MDDMMQVDFSEAVIDTKNRCIDRSTKLGKQFDMLMEYADGMADENMGKMIREFLVYSEAVLVINGLCPEDEAKEKVKALRSRMGYK